MAYENIAVFGASGAIGHALLTHLAKHWPDAAIHGVSASAPDDPVDGVRYHHLPDRGEEAIRTLVPDLVESGPLDLVIVASGILHDKEIGPEKSLKDLEAEKFERLFAANTIYPAMIAKHCLPKLHRKKRAVFAALSARVGSISDNSLGGWYAYRASKAALNMIIRNAGIELARQRREAIVIGLHPGTVDSALSEPFQSNVAEGKLFTPDYAAACLLEVIEARSPADSGKCFAWDGAEIAP